jgi:hypothetical protein
VQHKVLFSTSFLPTPTENTIIIAITTVVKPIKREKKGRQQQQQS